jgi:predicted alpha/beta-hydrolase family hydrolase
MVFAHGAGAGASHPWMRAVADGFARRGVSIVTFDFPYVEAGRRRPDSGPELEAAFADVWRDAVRDLPPRTRLFAGGKSMGGRIASQLAARDGFTPAPAGLVFFGYPLHPPRQPARRRDRHLPRIGVPMLFVHGTRDPFGSPDEMHALVDHLHGADLHLVEGGNHSLEAPKRMDPGGQSLEGALDRAAAWIRGHRGGPPAPTVPL